jgi:hypothetical protein
MNKVSGGYLVACVGTTGGGIVGAAIGQIVGLPVAAWAMTSVDFHTDAEGVEAFLEAIAMALLMFAVAVMVFVLVVLLALWLGAVVGCGVALRAARHDAARRTALLVGAIGPPVLVATIWVGDRLAGDNAAFRADTGYAMVIGVGIVSALAARGVALARP